MHLSDEVATIFSGPLAGFVSRRDALAVRLKQQGESDRAKMVKSIKKPSLVAWALDQVAHRNQKQLQWLLEADEKVRTAISTGMGRDQVRRAMRARQDLVAALTDQAIAALREDGYDASAHTKGSITRGLLAVGSDPALREQLVAGTLVDTPDPGETGFELVEEQVEEDLSRSAELKAQAESRVATARRDLEQAETDLASAVAASARIEEALAAAKELVDRKQEDVRKAVHLLSEAESELRSID